MFARQLIAAYVAAVVAIPAYPAIAQSAGDVAPASSAAAVTGPPLGANDPCTSIAAVVARPSQTTSVCTVRPNHVLIETGFQNAVTGPGASTIAYPQALVRIGTAIPVLEVDLGVPSYQRMRGATSANGATDAGAGLKYMIGYTPRFNYGVNVFFTAPTGSNGISAGGSTQNYNVNLGYTINSTLSLAGTIGVISLPDGAQHYASYLPSLCLSAGLPNASGVFIEAAEFTNAAGPRTPPRTQLMAGVTRDFGPRVQLDLEFGRSIGSGFVDSRFIGVGASYYH